MKKKYLNIFWASLAIIIILNEFVIGQIQFKTVGKINWGNWVFVALWFSIAAKNIYAFYKKQFTYTEK